MTKLSAEAYAIVEGRHSDLCVPKTLSALMT
jgi:hypothetical protein